MVPLVVLSVAYTGVSTTGVNECLRVPLVPVTVTV